MLVFLCAVVLAGSVTAAPAIDAGYTDADLLPAVFDTVRNKYTGVPEHFDGSAKFFQPNNDQSQFSGSQFDNPSSNNFAVTNFGSPQAFGRSPSPPDFQVATGFNPPQSFPQNTFAQPSQNTFAQPSPNFRNVPTSHGFQAQRPAITIVERNHQTDPSGQYSLSYRDSAGTSTSEEGRHKQSSLPQGGVVLAKSGKVSYTSPEGYLIKLSYTADENGYHPSG